MWNETKLRTLLNEVSEGSLDAGDINDSMAYDIADGVLATENGLEDYLRNIKGIQDPIAYIANYIF